MKSLLGPASVAVAVFAAGAWTLATSSTRYQLWMAEREINQVYRTQHPFDFRWQGAPHPMPGHSAFRVATPSTLSSLAERLARVQLDQHFDARRLLLSARVALLRGDFDRAIAEYRRQESLSGKDAGLSGEISAAYALRAEVENRPSDLGIALEYASEAVHAPSVPSFVLFNAALLEQRSFLLQVASQQWPSAIEAEADPAWRQDAVTRNLELRRTLAKRKSTQDLLRSLEGIASSSIAEPGALEIVQQEAILRWIGLPSPPRAQLAILAARFARDHQDSWWRDFLHSPLDRVAAGLLSEAATANTRGDYGSAEQAASQAEIAFTRLGNAAGRLRSRWERIEASHRGDNPAICANLMNGFERETSKRSYSWLHAQGVLDGITCRTLQIKGASLKERLDALQEIEPLGFEGITLRAMAFLSEPWVSAESPLTAWRQTSRGLSRFWSSVLPGYRAYHFCWNLAEASRLSGDDNASRLLLEEASLNLSDEPNRGLRASVLSDLAVAEARLGRYRFASAELSRASEFQAHSGSERYLFEVEIQKANADLWEGRPEAALVRLKNLQDHPTAEPNEMDRADWLNAMGTALLRLGRYPDAEDSFWELLDLHSAILGRAGNEREDESILRMYDAAVRGLTESEVKQGKPAQDSLSTWFALRNGTLVQRNATIHAPFPVPLVNGRRSCLPLLSCLAAFLVGVRTGG